MTLQEDQAGYKNQVNKWAKSEGDITVDKAAECVNNEDK